MHRIRQPDQDAVVVKRILYAGLVVFFEGGRQSDCPCTVYPGAKDCVQDEQRFTTAVYGYFCDNLRVGCNHTAFFFLTDKVVHQVDGGIFVNRKFFKQPGFCLCGPDFFNQALPKMSNLFAGGIIAVQDVTLPERGTGMDRCRWTYDDTIGCYLFYQPLAVSEKEDLRNAGFKNEFFFDFPELYICVFQINPIVTPVRDGAAIHHRNQPAAATGNQPVVDAIPAQTGDQGL